MTAPIRHMTKQMTKAWSPARRPTSVTFGHLVICLFNITYRAKYCLTKAWSPYWSSDPPKWSPARPNRGSWPHGHGDVEVVK